MRESVKKWEAPLLLLLLGALGATLFFALGAGNGHFSIYQPVNTVFFLAPGALPLAVLLILLLKFTVGKEYGTWAQTIGSVIVFIVMLGSPYVSTAMILLQLALYWVDRVAPQNQSASALFLAFGLFYLLLPVLLLFLRRDTFDLHFGLVTVFRECFILRTFSWIIFRRIYGRREFGTLQEFMEYFFSPAFFLMPNLLNLVSFGYFHERKTEPRDAAFFSAFLMGAWGLGLMFVYSSFRLHYFDSVLGPFLWKRGLHFDHWLLFGGFLSFVLIIAHHTAAMAFQVSMARFLGHNLRYDMNYPLLSRSPMELWRRDHNYTRQFLIENAMKPITLFLLRRRASRLTAFSLSALSAYGIMTIALLGWKPFGQENTPIASLGMVLFFTLTIFIPLIIWARPEGRKTKSRFLSILAGLEPLTPLKQWRWLDYALWVITLLILSVAKALIGSMRLLFGTR